MVTGTLWKQPAEAILNVAILSVFSFLKRHKVKDDSFLCYFVDVYCILFMSLKLWVPPNHFKPSCILISFFLKAVKPGDAAGVAIASRSLMPHWRYFSMLGRWGWQRRWGWKWWANKHQATHLPMSQLHWSNTKKPRQGLSIVWWRRLLCRLHLRWNQNIGQLSLLTLGDD